ncbi:hypothetical protein ACA910_010310 [Epithemia clementina (nom. ined.)]
MKTISSVITFMIWYVNGCQGFSFPSTHTVAGRNCHSEIAAVSNDKVLVSTSSESSTSNRRSFMEGIVKGSIITATTAVTFLSVTGQPAVASGGATAGGAYLLSAKQRYNDRVKSGVIAFLALQPLLEKGDIDGIRAYFTSEDVGAWKDLTTAGYLLANAFRRNSTAAPDSLPSVKAWKGFAGQVEKMTASLKKKDTAGAIEAYKSALSAIDDYLEKVELPSAKELAS